MTVDDLRAEAKPRSVVCHASSSGILPVQWCLKNGVGLERPQGCQGQDFDWADYLKQSGTEAAPDACFPDVRERGESGCLRVEKLDEKVKKMLFWGLEKDAQP